MNKNQTLCVDRFFAAAWKRWIDFIWLLIYGIPLALVLIISRKSDFLDDVPDFVIIIFPFILFGCGYMSLKKFTQLLSDR